jgi:hypothetical protein
MLVHTAAVVRLKCSFHCNVFLFISTNRFSQSRSRASRFGVQS